MQSYDNSRPSEYILYLDANNLYDWEMNQYLPYGKCKWLNLKKLKKLKEIDKFDVRLIVENSLDGCILEVDFEYPDELYKFHNDYPISDKLEINDNILSKYCSSIANKFDIKIGGVNKLIPNLSNKSEYVPHYRNLQLYLSLGMKFVSAYRILKFKQSN